jgi:arginyl-tRNA synthetase
LDLLQPIFADRNRRKGEHVKPSELSLLFRHVCSQFVGATKSVFGIDLDVATVVFPPDVLLGDFTVACFELAKKVRESPIKVSEKIVSAMSETEFIGKVSAVGPYVNIKIHPTVLFRIISEEMVSGESWFRPTGERVMVEYLSPNTNKPIHLGHARNGILGMAISNILEAVGHSVIKANLVNDRGIPICKSMVAYKKWGHGETPDSKGVKGDHFVGDFYVLYAKSSDEDSSLGAEVKECLRKWEASDQDTVALWCQMNSWVYAGFAETYRTYGFTFDVTYYESETYQLGKNIVQEGIRSGVFEHLADGSVVARLPVDEFGEDEAGKPRLAMLVRDDGTSVYMTQDLGTATLKFEGHDLTQSIHVVGNEQKHHFKCLFFLLKQLGFSWAAKCHHLPYGMVYLPDGRMKSREGKVVDADDLAKEMVDLAREEIVKRVDQSVTTEVVAQRAQKIGMAAIKFFLLKMNSEKDIYFNPKESLSFEGNTGPYCQYAYARAQSILSRRESLEIADVLEPNFSLLGEKEELLIARSIMQFPQALKGSADELNPSVLCDWAYNAARAFNQFYHKHMVIHSEVALDLACARIKLLKAFCATLGYALNLLGIETVDEM